MKDGPGLQLITIRTPWSFSGKFQSIVSSSPWFLIILSRDCVSPTWVYMRSLNRPLWVPLIQKV